MTGGTLLVAAQTSSDSILPNLVPIGQLKSARLRAGCNTDLLGVWLFGLWTVCPRPGRAGGGQFPVITRGEVPSRRGCQALRDWTAASPREHAEMPDSLKVEQSNGRRPRRLP